MKKFFVFVLSLVLLVPMLAQADSMPDGYHPIDNYFILQNAQKYPEYNFYITGDFHGRVRSELLTTTSTQFSDVTGGNFIAVKKTDVNKLASGAVKNCDECGDNWFELPTNAKYILNSNMIFIFEGSVSGENQTTSRTYTVAIDGIAGNTLKAHLVDQTSQNAEQKPSIDIVKIPTTSLNQPTTSNSINPIPSSGTVATTSEVIHFSIPKSSLNSILVSLVVMFLGAVGIVVISRTWKK